MDPSQKKGQFTILSWIIIGLAAALILISYLVQLYSDDKTSNIIYAVIQIGIGASVAILVYEVQSKGEKERDDILRKLDHISMLQWKMRLSMIGPSLVELRENLEILIKNLRKFYEQVVDNKSKNLKDFEDYYNIELKNKIKQICNATQEIKKSGLDLTQSVDRAINFQRLIDLAKCSHSEWETEGNSLVNKIYSLALQISDEISSLPEDPLPAIDKFKKIKSFSQLLTKNEWVVIYGSKVGLRPGQKREAEVDKEAAEFLQSNLEFKEKIKDCITDQKFENDIKGSKQYKDKNLIIIGGASANSITNGLKKSLLVQYLPSLGFYSRIDNISYGAEDMACIQLLHNVDYTKKYAIIVFGIRGEITKDVVKLLAHIKEYSDLNRKKRKYLAKIIRITKDNKKPYEIMNKC
jgi:hypothetical protein